MTRMVKEFIIAFLCAMFAFMFITSTNSRENFIMASRASRISGWYVKRQAEYDMQENEAINTYYVDTGSYNGTDFSTAAIYEFDTRTGEWSDGGNYVIHGGNLCEVNKYGERTKIGQIITWN